MGVETTCCCGCSLQRGSKIIAICDIFIAFLTLITFLFFDKLTQFMERYLDPAYLDKRTVDNEDTLFEALVGRKLFTFGDGGSETGFEVNPVVYMILALLWATCDIAISVLLIHGSNNRRKSSCKWWFRFRVLFLMGFIVYFFVCMTKSRLFLYGFVDVFKIFYRIYCLCSVDSFIRQLERERCRSIHVPHVQVVTPDGSYAELFPNRDNFQPDFYTTTAAAIDCHDELSPPSCRSSNPYTRLD